MRVSHSVFQTLLLSLSPSFLVHAWVADFSGSQELTDIPNRVESLVDAHANRFSTHKNFKIIDSNGDGQISISELQEASNFMWNDLASSERARVTFGVGHPADFISAFDVDGDGELSEAEFSIPMSEISETSSNKCSSLTARLDTCKTHQIIKCSAYLNTAEQMCRMGHRNVVEQCILSSPCASICNCVSHAEKAAHGQSVLVLQYPDGHQESMSSLSPIGNTSKALGAHQPQKRFFFFFLGLIIAEIINISISVALLTSSEIIANTGRQVAFMDFNVWNADSGDPPPSCSVYVFWSRQCGAIGTGTARGCSDGGSRLYGNSCKDHFRYGSKGCGVLDLGCKSLCYAINNKGCPCSIFDNWLEQDKTNYPGNDIESLHVSKISDCRHGCASNPACLAFVIPPPDGTNNQLNCFFKGVLGSFTASAGVTSFIKISTNATTCPTSLAGADDQFGVFNRREISSKHNLVTRVDENGIGKAFPFDPTDLTYLIISRFLVALYETLWLNQEQVQRTSFQTTLNAIGSLNLEPDPGEPVAQTANPRWRVSDGWRLVNIFRAIMLQAASSPNPVAAVMNQQGTTPLDNAIFPTAVRSLLIDNEATINGNTQPWAGSTGSTDPYPGVLTAHAGPSRLSFYQGGAMGPFSLEAAFILATQLAGINWVQFTNRRRTDRVRRAPFWLNAIVPRGIGPAAIPQCLRQYDVGQEFSDDMTRSRRIGFLSRSGLATGDIGAGFYLILDIDGEDDVSANPTRNVFVFAVHVIDQHSRINVPNPNSLRALQYQRYTPGDEAQEPPRGPTTRAQQRFFAHGHAAWVPFNQIETYIEQDQNGPVRVDFPDYQQIGGFHLYILSEDENNLWPRFSYLNNDNGARKHDGEA